MYLHVNDKEAPNYEVIDLETGKVIKGVQWADDEKGELEKFVYKENGDLIFLDGRYLKVVEHKNIKLITKSKEG